MAAAIVQQWGVAGQQHAGGVHGGGKFSLLGLPEGSLLQVISMMRPCDKVQLAQTCKQLEELLRAPQVRHTPDPLQWIDVHSDDCFAVILTTCPGVFCDACRKASGAT